MQPSRNARMVVPNADDQLPIDDLLNIVAAGVDELVQGSDAAEARPAMAGLAG